MNRKSNDHRMPTRGRPGKASKSETAPEVTTKPLPPVDQDPPKLWILPESLSKDARIITLAHPRTLTPTRYYHCPETGLHEIKRIAAPPSTRRSVLLWPEQESPEVKESAGEENGNAPDGSPSSQGYVLKSAAFFTVTPIDPLFLILPALSPKPKETNSKGQGKVFFLSADDILECFYEHSKHLQHISQHEATRNILENRMGVICDQVEAGDEKMYRLNTDKLMRELFAKAERMAEGGLPESMEQHFVKRALDVPLASLLKEEEETKLKREESTSSAPANEAMSLSFNESQTTQSSMPSLDSQTSFSTTSTTLTVPDQSFPVAPTSILHPTEQIIHLLRLRTALSFIMSSYVPDHLASAIEAILETDAANRPVDFAPLTIHLKLLAEHRAEVNARAKIIGGSRKRQYEDEEENEARAEKKQKEEEEERKKKLGESRGVKNLKKVDTTGMKKLSDFFKKK